MPSGSMKNALYGLALPVLGKRCEWKAAEGGELSERVTRVLRRHHVVGACVQRLKSGALAEQYTAGYATLEPHKAPVTADTVFRSASIAKLATALLVFRLQTQGKLDVCEEVGAFLGYPVRSPYCPEAPVTLGMLMSHTSGIVDSPAYFRAMEDGWKLSTLLCLTESFRSCIPGTGFRYSNLAAGMIGSMLEKRFDESLEALAQRELFEPLGVKATFDASTLAGAHVADSYRVLPRALAFSAQQRIQNAKPLDAPDPERHFALASGNLFLTAKDLGKLALAAHTGNGGFISERCLELLKSRVTRWPDEQPELYHGMGALQTTDPRLGAGTVYGHQGIAYGAVNGVMWNDAGDGFAMLCSGASERRRGHLALVNRELAALFMNGADEKRV